MLRQGRNVLYQSARNRYGKLSVVELEQKVAEAFAQYVAEKERGITMEVTVPMSVSESVYRQELEHLRQMGVTVHNRKEMEAFFREHPEIENPLIHEPLHLSKSDTRLKKDIANVQQDLLSVAKNYEKVRSSYGFLTDITNALGISKDNASEYVSFVTPSGIGVTIRISNHNAKAEWFKEAGELTGNISVIIKNKGKKNTFEADDDVELIEYVYFKEDIKNSDQNILSQIATSLSKMMQTGKYEDTTGLARPNVSPKPKKLRTSTGEVYGFAYQGELYIDETKLRADTPLHEYTHLWDEAVAKIEPSLWKRGVELMRDTHLWTTVMKSEAYGKRWQRQGKSAEEIEQLTASEVHSRLVGKEGAKLLAEIEKQQGGEGIVAKLKQWLVDMFRTIAKTFGVWTDEMLADLTLEDFVKMTVRDFAEGVREVLQNLGIAEGYLSEFDIAAAIKGGKNCGQCLVG